jgi:hypothetical protein
MEKDTFTSQQQEPGQNPSTPEIAPTKSPHIDIPQPDAPPAPLTTPERPAPIKS